jgi:hypothetical protein
MVPGMAQILGNASVQYGDFSGTAEADKADVGYPGLYKSVKLDSEKWWIVAFDIWAGEVADLEKAIVRVYAIDRASGITNHEELQAYGLEHGAAPVTEFQVHGISAVQIVRDSFKRFAVQLRSRSLEGVELDVVAQGDLNYTG